MIWLILFIVGGVLALWAMLVNPACWNYPEVIPQVWVTHGPYKWLRHPLYVGTWIYVTALAGYGGGLSVALAVGSVLELLFRDWINREKAALLKGEE